MKQLRQLVEERPDEKVCADVAIADSGKYFIVRPSRH